MNPSLEPVNAAHSLMRRSVNVGEQGDYGGAIELLQMANDYLTQVVEAVKDEPILRKSFDLQLVENDWKIHTYALKARCEFDSSSSEDTDNSKCGEKETEDDDTVLIDFTREFFTDSLNPNRTMMVMGRRQRRRCHSTPSIGVDSLGPNIENLMFSGGKKLPKTDANREEEIVEMVKVNQQLARDFFT